MGLNSTSDGSTVLGSYWDHKSFSNRKEQSLEQGRLEYESQF